MGNDNGTLWEFQIRGHALDHQDTPGFFVVYPYDLITLLIFSWDPSKALDPQVGNHSSFFY